MLGFPVHEVNLDRKSAGSPYNMTESVESVRTINENKKHDEILMVNTSLLFIVFFTFYVRHLKMLKQSHMKKTSS